MKVYREVMEDILRLLFMITKHDCLAADREGLAAAGSIDRISDWPHYDIIKELGHKAHNLKLVSY